MGVDLVYELEAFNAYGVAARLSSSVAVELFSQGPFNPEEFFQVNPGLLFYRGQTLTK